MDRINPVGGERVGYPTQKPEALLERVILASTEEGQIVLDPFCGCGTTVAVAERLHRQWIGIDISPTAVNVMKRRLVAMGAQVETRRVPTTPEELKLLEPLEFQNWVIERVLGSHQVRKSGDLGIDGFSFFEKLPIQVKQSERVGRNVVDNFETAIQRHGSHKGYIVAFSFGRGAIDEAARTRLTGGPEVVLVKLKDLVRVGDLIEAAESDKRAPDLRDVTPDMIGLFNPEQRTKRKHPFFTPPGDQPKRSAKTVVESARRSSPRQLRLS